MHFDKADGKCCEIVFSKTQGSIFINDIDSISINGPQLLKNLLGFDPTAKEGFGSVVFPILGIALTGYHPNIIEDRTVAAFQKGRWDSLLDDMKALQ